MPIVVVTAECLPDEPAEITAATAPAEAVADALQLLHHGISVTLTEKVWVQWVEPDPPR